MNSDSKIPMRIMKKQSQKGWDNTKMATRFSVATIVIFFFFLTYVRAEIETTATTTTFTTTATPLSTIFTTTTPLSIACNLSAISCGYFLASF